MGHYLVHCPHCNRPKSEHMASMLTRIVKAVLAVENLVVPADDTRSKEDFNSSTVLWGSFMAYPDQVLSALQDWVEFGRTNQFPLS